MNIRKKNKSKEVVIFHPSIEDGGVEKNLYLIANFLSLKIKKVSLITCHNKNDKFNKKLNIIRPIIKVNENSGRIIKYFLCLFTLIWYCVKKKRKFIVLSFQANIYTIIICVIFNIKIISRSNSSPSGWSKNFFKRIIFKYFLKRANQIIVNSIEFKKELDKKFNVKSKLIYNPFNFAYIKKKSKEKVSLKFFKRGHLKLVNVARLTDQKDHLTLLKAVNLAKKYRNIQLIIVGKGIYKKRLINFINQHSLNDSVRLVGYQKNPFKFISKCDVFVLTSIFEGHPNVLVEALFLKKFIISSNCPTGPQEILGNGKYGNMFKTGNANQLAKILINFKLDKKNKKKVVEGHGTLKLFDFHKNCNEYLRIVKKFI